MINNIAPYCIVALLMLWLISIEVNYRKRVEDKDIEWRDKVHGKH